MFTFRRLPGLRLPSPSDLRLPDELLPPYSSSSSSSSSSPSGALSSSECSSESGSGSYFEEIQTPAGTRTQQGGTHCKGLPCLPLFFQILSTSVVPHDYSFSVVTASEETREILRTTRVDDVDAELCREIAEPLGRGKIQNCAHVEQYECVQLIFPRSRRHRIFEKERSDLSI